MVGEEVSRRRFNVGLSRSIGKGFLGYINCAFELLARIPL